MTVVPVLRWNEGWSIYRFLSWVMYRPVAVLWQNAMFGIHDKLEQTLMGCLETWQKIIWCTVC